MKINFGKEKKKGLLLEPKKLLFVWHLLSEYKQRTKKKNTLKRGANFISPASFFFLYDYKVISEAEINYFLTQLVEDKLIKELYIEVNKHDEAKDTLVHVETKHYTHQIIKKEKLKDPLFNLQFDIKPYAAFIFSYDIKIDKSNMDKYIAGYLNKWEDDKLISMETNVLKAKNQIEIITKQIFELLEKHPPSMLLLDYSKKEGMDLLAVLLFLENKKCIKIHDMQFVSRQAYPLSDQEKYRLSFRISIEDIFYDYFDNDGSSYYPRFDFDQLSARKTRKSHKNEEDVIILSYDERGKKLMINNDEIDISKSNHQHDLLKILFDEKPFETDLDFVEIAEMIDHGNVENDIVKEKARRRYYQAANQLNTKIALQTTIKKIFKTKRRLIRFNPLYKFKVS